MTDRNTSDNRKVLQERRGLDTYHKMLSTRKRDELVKKHLKLVSFIAARLAIGLPDWIDKRDLISAGEHAVHLSKALWKD